MEDLIFWVDPQAARDLAEVTERIQDDASSGVNWVSADKQQKQIGDVWYDADTKNCYFCNKDMSIELFIEPKLECTLSQLECTLSPTTPTHRIDTETARGNSPTTEGLNVEYELDFGSFDPFDFDIVEDEETPEDAYERAMGIL